MKVLGAPWRALREVHWPLALVSFVCLWASAPPAWLPGAGLLVVPGWLAFYAATSVEGAGVRVRRPYFQAWLVGTLHMLAFSFSIRHLLLPALIAIGVVGGLYYVLTVAWTRALARWIPGPCAFGLALAGALWLRANFTEIQYPHGQPVHCLYLWPGLLGSLAWGSEILGNVLIGVLAAGLCDVYRAWRVGRPGFGRSVAVLVGFVVVFVVSAFPPGSVPGPDATVRIAALEPGLGFDDFFGGRVRLLFPARVLEPTRRAASAHPDLLVWPESIHLHELDGDELRWVTQGPPDLGLQGDTRLLAGTSQRLGESGIKVVAVLTAADGRLLGYHEKQRLVPGGEHQPFLGLLPEGVTGWIRDGFKRAFNLPLPDLTPGAPRPPLQTARGVPFGAMVCFDNAFPQVVEQHVRAGASFLVVVSNEAWYRGGAELEQMVAMTVCRALECRVPIVRCTVDGASVVVDAGGRVVQRLPEEGAKNATAARILAVDLRVQARGHRAVPPLHPFVRWVVLLSVLALAVPRRRIGDRMEWSPAPGDHNPPSARARPSAGS